MGLLRDILLVVGIEVISTKSVEADFDTPGQHCRSAARIAVVLFEFVGAEH